MPGENDDGEDADCQADHQPRLGMAREHAARGRSLIDDRCRAGNGIGHD
jgi:hypothetical protein